MKENSVVQVGPTKDTNVMARTGTIAEVMNSVNFIHNIVMKHVLEH